MSISQWDNFSFLIYLMKIYPHPHTVPPDRPFEVVDGQ